MTFVLARGSRPRDSLTRHGLSWRRTWRSAAAALLLTIGSVDRCPAQPAASDLFALRTRGAPADVSATSAALERDLGVELQPNAVAARLGIIVFRKPAGRARDAFADAVRRWLSTRPHVVNLPLTRHERGYAVTTGRIIVDFEPGVAPADARAALGRLPLTIVQEPTWFRPTRFVVDARDPRRADGLLKALDTLPGLRFAEPDLLLLGPARQ